MQEHLLRSGQIYPAAAVELIVTMLKINHSFQVHFRISNTFESWSLWRGGWYGIYYRFWSGIKSKIMKTKKGIVEAHHCANESPERGWKQGGRQASKGARGEGSIRSHPDCHRPPKQPHEKIALVSENICVQILKHICWNFEIYLSKLWNIFVDILKYILWVKQLGL